MNFHKDIRGYVWYHLSAKFRVLNGLISTIFFLINCFVRNIKVGKNVKAFGISSMYRHPLSNFTIGNNCTFHSSYNSNILGLSRKCRILTGDKYANLFIGNNVGLSGSTIIASLKVIIEDDVMIGANCLITDTDHHSTSVSDRLASNLNVKKKPVIIKRGVWLGMNVTILKGVTIGKNSIIGANSLVTKDIPDNVIAVGNPCKVIKQINAEDN